MFCDRPRRLVEPPLRIKPEVYASLQHVGLQLHRRDRLARGRVYLRPVFTTSLQGAVTLGISRPLQSRRNRWRDSSNHCPAKENNNPATAGRRRTSKARSSWMEASGWIATASTMSIRCQYGMESLSSSYSCAFSISSHWCYSIRWIFPGRFPKFIDRIFLKISRYFLKPSRAESRILLASKAVHRQVCFHLPASGK